MIAIATYLSLNLWIRGIYEFLLTLFLVISLDIKNTFSGSLSVIKATSKVFAFGFILFLFIISFFVAKHFIKNKDPEKWPKGLLELYEPVTATKKSVFTYNLVFIVKRLLLALNVTIFTGLGNSAQLTASIVVIVGSTAVTIAFVRFKSKVTMAIYLL